MPLLPFLVRIFVRLLQIKLQTRTGDLDDIAITQFYAAHRDGAAVQFRFFIFARCLQCVTFRRMRNDTCVLAGFAELGQRFG